MSSLPVSIAALQPARIASAADSQRLSGIKTVDYEAVLVIYTGLRPKVIHISAGQFEAATDIIR